MFADLKKRPILGLTPEKMFTTELREKTKLMALDTFLTEQLNKRNERKVEYPHWSKEKLAGYEQGIIDLALDCKNKIKELEG